MLPSSCEGKGSADIALARLEDVSQEVHLPLSDVGQGPNERGVQAVEELHATEHISRPCEALLKDSRNLSGSGDIDRCHSRVGGHGIQQAPGR